MNDAQCRFCGAMRHDSETSFYCSSCDSFFQLQLTRSLTKYDLIHFFQENRGIWSFKDLLPPLPSYLTYHEGHTPLFRFHKIFSGELNVFFKDESRNPSGTFRDRCASLMACHAKSLETHRILCGTSGNHGVSMLTYGLPLNLQVTCITPLMARLHKITQIRTLGGEIIAHGTYLSESIEKARILSKQLGYYDATPENNYLTIQGQKTVAYELLVQLDRKDLEITSSTVIFVPLGAGLMLLSLYQGFKDLLELNIIEEMPRLVGVGLKSMRNGHQATLPFVPPELLPLTGESQLEREIHEALSEVDGYTLSLNERLFLEQSHNVARNEGIIVDPASASVIAGIQESVSVGKIDVDDVVIAVLTSSGTVRNVFYQKSLNLFNISKKRRNPFLTKYLILDFLARHGPHNGYQIWKHVSKSVRCQYQAVYQHLNELSRMKVIAPYNQPKEGMRRRKQNFWLITGMGFEYLDALTTIFRTESEEAESN